MLTILVYAVLLGSVDWTELWIFLVLIGGYWLGLGANYLITGQTMILPYFAVTPMVVAVTVVALPQFIEADGATHTKVLAIMTGVLATMAVGCSRSKSTPKRRCILV